VGELSGQMKGLHMRWQFFENFLYTGLQSDKYYSHSDSTYMLEILLMMLVRTTALLCHVSEAEPLVEILALSSVSRQWLTTFNCSQ